MDKTQWSKVREIFDHLSDKSPSHRRDYLDMVCEGSPELRAEVESLLTAHDGLDDIAPWDSAFATKAPEQIGDYVIEGTLGQGGVGTVYQARHPIHGEVALKVLPPLNVANDVARLRFEREVAVLQRLEHPSLCQVFDWFVDNHGAVLAMERIEGQELRQVITQGALSLLEALRIIRTLAEVLQLAHAAGIVHRDLKPSNVLLDQAGKVRLIDFGIAKFADEKLTATGTILGSPHYMSPEQWQGKAMDARTDLWSLGCLLYELLCAQRAFNGNDMGEIAKAVLQQEPAPLPQTSVDGQPLAPVGQVLKRLLAKDPNERFQDCSAVLSALNKH